MTHFLYLVDSTRRRGQLQHRSVLPLVEPIDQHDLTIREFKRVVVRIRLVHIHLTKTSQPLPDVAIGKKVIFDIFLEGQFGPRKKAHRDIRLPNRGETTGDGVFEPCRYQLVAGFRWSGRNEV